MARPELQSRTRNFRVASESIFLLVVSSLFSFKCEQILRIDKKCKFSLKRLNEEGGMNHLHQRTVTNTNCRMFNKKVTEPRLNYLYISILTLAHCNPYSTSRSYDITTSILPRSGQASKPHFLRLDDNKEVFCRLYVLYVHYSMAISVFELSPRLSPETPSHQSCTYSSFDHHSTKALIPQKWPERYPSAGRHALDELIVSALL